MIISLFQGPPSPPGYPEVKFPKDRESTREEMKISRKNGEPLYERAQIVSAFVRSGKRVVLSRRASQRLMDNYDMKVRDVSEIIDNNFCLSQKAQYNGSSWCDFNGMWAANDEYLLNPNENNDFYCKLFIRSKGSVLLSSTSFHPPRYSY
ncbi:hypothetical protein HX037_06395 [Ignatzschineria indica]|uniref:hypothetical protein n=1 Tax=Ignatzschineria indica TaxID=472583 RepID=UPI0025783961|nr:hypothetical protein [Ignatzschineria indica]MDM1545514.1 hypothetical protein [Ignatzschineria indica]